MAAIPLQVVRGDGTAGQTDRDLVEALFRGSQQAQLAVWNRFSPRADATLRRLLGPEAEREDLLQDVFLRFFRAVATLRDPAAVGGFLTAICVHVVHTEIRRRRRRGWLRLTSTGEMPEISVPHADSEARDAIARYYRLLDTLRVDDRSVFVARTIEGLTLAEVASLHDLSVSTTQRRIVRATKRMAELVRRDPVLMNLARGRGADR